MTPQEIALRKDLSIACRLLAADGYADLTLGHVSARVIGSTILIKKKGVALDEVGVNDLALVDLEDEEAFLGDGMHLESVLHTEVYKQRPDLGAVIHGHPPFGTAFGATGAKFEMLTHDHALFIDSIASYDGSPELITEMEQGKAVASALGHMNVLLLRNHGVLITGKDLRWAVFRAITFERAIKLQAIASGLGPLRPFSEEVARQMYEEKFQDNFLDEYWAGWLRQLERNGPTERQ